MQVVVVTLTVTTGALVTVHAAVQHLPRLFAVATISLGVGTLLSVLLAAWVKRQTLGLDPREITTLYQHNDAVLHAIREGVLVVDGEGRLLRAACSASRPRPRDGCSATASPRARCAPSSPRSGRRATRPTWSATAY